MTEEYPIVFPPVNYDKHELICAVIRLELDKAGIIVQQVGIDYLNDIFTATTDKDVPEKTEKYISDLAKSKGITITFKTKN